MNIMFALYCYLLVLYYVLNLISMPFLIKRIVLADFNDEDFFDINQVEKILKQLPVVVQKNLKKFLYPSDGNQLPQRLLLLGGVANADTTAVAKAIVLRWGYDYYLIEAAAFLQASHEKRDSLLS